MQEAKDRKKIQFLRKELRRAYSRADRRAEGSPEIARARSLVSKAISQAKKKIRKDHEDLAEHLTSFIKGGILYSYGPPTPLLWLV